MSDTDAHPALRDAAARILDQHGLELEEITVHRRSGTTEARLVVDLPEDQLGSADLDTVSAAATALNELIDADESLLGPGPSLLEVTTAGVDRPLTTPRHFRRSRGRLLAITTEGGQQHRARLLAVEDELLHLRQEPGRDDRGRPVRLPKGTPERFELSIGEVAAAVVQVEFDPPADLEQLLAGTDTTVKKES
jgi:ribosome maturation factor RimP